jgi:hypothetical protein
MTAPAPDFRAELEFLVELYEELGGNWTPHGYTDNWNDALASARTALATSPPEPPTVMEILDLSGEIEDAGLGQIDLVRAALKRWGNS